MMKLSLQTIWIGIVADGIGQGFSYHATQAQAYTAGLRAKHGFKDLEAAAGEVRYQASATEAKELAVARQKTDLTQARCIGRERFTNFEETG